MYVITIGLLLINYDTRNAYLAFLKYQTPNSCLSYGGMFRCCAEGTYSTRITGGVRRVCLPRHVT